MISRTTNIEELVREVRLSRTLSDYRNVHQRLGTHIEQVSDTIKKLNKDVERAERALRRLYKKGILNTSSEAAPTVAERDEAKRFRDVYIGLGRMYRMVGDALAWKVYRFQTLPIYAYGLNSSPGINANSRHEGAEAEAEEIEKLWSEKGAFALRHDYTNCLRVGDLSVLYPDSHTLEILEVKVDGREVTHAQKEMGRRAVDLTERGKTTTLVPDITIEHVLFDGLPVEELVDSISAFYEDELKQDSSELLSSLIREPDGRHHFHSILTYSSLEEVWRASEICL